MNLLFPATAMTADTPVYHGGNLAAARRRFAGAPEPWLDLSTGINPWSYPVPEMGAEVWSRLPEPDFCADVEAIAARRYGACDGAAIVAAPGTQALIQLLPLVLDARRVGILDFTYGEYARTWERAGAACTTVESLDALAGCDVAVVVNPNNPDGRLVPANALTELAETMRRQGRTLVVDEAFMDVLPPGTGLIPVLPSAGVVVLRSVGKAYGLAGIRLGFALGDPAIVGGLRDRLGPWAVCGPALAAGRAALSDDAWLPQTVARLEERAAALDKVFGAAGAALAGGTPLFRLYAHEQSPALFDRLGRCGILVRPFPARSGWLRVGIPKDPADLDRLRDALT